MLSKYAATGCCLFCIVVSLCGCVVPPPTPARLYNLDTGEIITAQMDYTSEGHGRMTAQLPDGEAFSGEYTIRPPGVPYGPPAPYETPRKASPPDEQASEEEETQEGDSMTWAEIYGFGPDAYAQPVGSATLVGDRGTVLEIVIYSYYYRRGLHGDGVARDNRGNWYRIHIGEIDDSGGLQFN